MTLSSAAAGALGGVATGQLLRRLMLHLRAATAAHAGVYICQQHCPPLHVLALRVYVRFPTLTAVLHFLQVVTADYVVVATGMYCVPNVPVYKVRAVAGPALQHCVATQRAASFQQQ